MINSLGSDISPHGFQSQLSHDTASTRRQLLKASECFQAQDVGDNLSHLSRWLSRMEAAIYFLSYVLRAVRSTRCVLLSDP